MKVRKLHVSNIRSYSDMEIDFESGVTVVSGVNGSGKSSLLEACFMGLFGSRGVPKNFILSDMVRKGCGSAEILLAFEHRGHLYEIIHQFKNDPEAAKASTTKSLLKRDGEIIADQVARTYDVVRELLRMDEEAYRNCVYIRQGEIDVLINAKPKDRQKMIDDLLQIGRLEEYRQRAKAARTGLRRHITEAEARIKDHEEDIGKLEAAEPLKRLHSLREKTGQYERELKELESQKERAARGADRVREQIERYTDLEKQRTDLHGEIGKLREDKGKALKAGDEARRNITELEKARLELAAKIEALRREMSVGEEADVVELVSEAEKEERQAYTGISDLEGNEKAAKQKQRGFRDQLGEAEKNLGEARDRITRLQKQADEPVIETKESEKWIGDIKRETGEIYAALEKMGFDRKKTEQMEEIAELVADRHRQIRGKIVELETREAELRKRIKHNRELLEKGFCPTCGQDLHGSPVYADTDAGEEKLRELTGELEKTREEEKEIQERIELVKEAGKKLKKTRDLEQEKMLAETRLRNSEKEMKDNAARLTEAQEEEKQILSRTENLKGQLKAGEKELGEIAGSKEKAVAEHAARAGKLEKLKALSRDIRDAGDMEAGIKRLREKEAESRDKVDFIDEQIAGKQNSVRELDAKLGEEDTKQLGKKLEALEMAYKGLAGEIGTLNEQKAEALRETGQAETDLQRLKELKDRLGRFANKKLYLDSVYAEAGELEDMYMRLRADLRARNVEALGRLLNEIFMLMYTNNAYSHIRLDNDYELTVYEKDGTPLEPRLLSGGERAIFNLVLRCAVYKLLSKGLEGGAYDNEMPPLILDEPTVFLDRGHVGQLIKLIDLMRETGSGQIIIVSHDETLIDSADNVFDVEKDPATNISAIEAR